MSLFPSTSYNISKFVGKLTQSHDTSNWILENGAYTHLIYNVPFPFLSLSLSLIILEMEHVSFNDLLNYQMGHLFLCTLLVKLNCQI